MTHIATIIQLAQMSLSLSQLDSVGNAKRIAMFYKRFVIKQLGEAGGPIVGRTCVSDRNDFRFYFVTNSMILELA